MPRDVERQVEAPSSACIDSPETSGTKGTSQPRAEGSIGGQVELTNTLNSIVTSGECKEY